MVLGNLGKVVNALKSYWSDVNLDFLAWLKITPYFSLETQSSFHKNQLEQYQRWFLYSLEHRFSQRFN